VPAVAPPTITTPINPAPPAKQEEEEQLSAEERRVLIGHLEGQEGQVVLTARQQLALLQERKFREQGFQPFSAQSDNRGRFQPDQPRSQQRFQPKNQRFQPQQQLVCDTFKNCEGLSRVAFMDGNGVVMLGKVVSCEKKEEGAAGGKKK